MHASSFITFSLTGLIVGYITDLKNKELILKTLPAEWHEKAHVFFQITSDQYLEWFLEGATTMDKKLILQNIIQQSQMIRMRVTNVFFSFSMPYI